MSSLIVTLPSSMPTAATPCSTVWTEDGSTVKRHLDAPLTLLPQTPDAEVVVLIPAAQLSWHRVEFPKGTLERGFFQEGNAPRLRAVLDGLLEERLLDDPAQLHFAIQPQARADAPNWVAACNRAWLHAWLAALEQTGRPVARIVPELAPPPDAAPDAITLNAIGTAELAKWVCSGPHGVLVLPLAHSSLALLPHNVDAPVVLAEPAVAALAEQYFAGRVSLQTAAQRAMAAATSEWDLAQFDLLRTRGTRTRKQLSQLANELLRSPRWKPARWAVVAIILANVIGLQAWAWKEQAALAAKRTAVREILTMTFPDVRVVVDAPLQMARALADLQRQSGAAASGDLETMLGEFQTLAPEIAAPTAIEFVAGELRLKLADPSVATLPTAITRLQAQGYSATQDGDRLVLKQQERRP
ncbi:MAG: type II secretion system protein GspL [Rhodoferax sp.]